MIPTFRGHGLPPWPGIHTPDAVSKTFTREMKILCTYCNHEREAFKWDGAWWHAVARGNDMGQSEPCRAGKLRNAGLGE